MESQRIHLIRMGETEEEEQRASCSIDMPCGRSAFKHKMSQLFILTYAIDLPKVPRWS